MHRAGSSGIILSVTYKVLFLSHLLKAQSVPESSEQQVIVQSQGPDEYVSSIASAY